MLKILLLFALLIAGIVLGPMIAGHQGYVLIQTDNYNIETSVTGLVIILILAMVVLFAIEWLLRRIFPVSYTHLRAHETRHDLVCRLLLEKKKKKHRNTHTEPCL